jgi:soluble lytic murein transglycosylase-like protein
MRWLKQNWFIIVIFMIIIIVFVCSVAKKSENKIKIDMDKVYDIESNHNLRDISPKGARGIGQVMRGTWNECTVEMGVNWDYDSDSFDPQKNMRVSEYYLNVIIPRYLKHYDIPDTVETRLAAYNCGIGRLNKNYRQYGESWKQGIPQETRNYIEKYYARF